MCLGRAGRFGQHWNGDVVKLFFWVSFYHIFKKQKLFILLFKLMCYPIWISYLNFRAVLALPKTASSAQAHKSISFIWIIRSTLYVYLWTEIERFYTCNRSPNNVHNKVRLVELQGLCGISSYEINMYMKIWIVHIAQMWVLPVSFPVDLLLP